MHRLTAKFLFVFALVGNLVPLALAATSVPARSCCVRKAAHHCHGSAASESDHRTIRSSGCCNHDCCRAAATAHWAQPQPRPAAFCLPAITARLAGSPPDFTAAESAGFQSTRAPPAC